MAHPIKISPYPMLKIKRSPEGSSGGSNLIIARLIQMTPKTRLLFAHDRQTSRLIDYASAVPNLPFGLAFERSDKAHMWDYDGNAYLDFSMGAGAYLLGHQAPALIGAALETIETGAPRLSPSPLALPLAEKLAAVMPAMEQVLFAPDPAQAFVAALRIARGHTGRRGVALACGGDWPVPLPPSIAQEALKLPYCDPGALDVMARERENLSVVVLSPFDPESPDDRPGVRDWLAAISDTGRKNGILVLLDERLSGLRLALGGAQERYGLAPDLVVLGHTLAPGLPLAALGGLANIMGQIKARETIIPMYRQDHAPLGEMADLHLPLAVAHAQIVALGQAAQNLYPALETESLRLSGLINDFTEANQFPIVIRRAGSILRLEGEAGLLRNLTLHLLTHGIYWPADQLAFLSGAHTPDDIDAAALAIQKSLLDMRVDGCF